MRFLLLSAQVEPILLSSRDGVRFHRWPDAIIDEDAPNDRKGNRSNYMTWGMLRLPGKPGEISVYATENYCENTPGRVGRFVYRVDGFVALRGGPGGGEVLTMPLRFTGRELLVNYAVRKGGSLAVEVLSESGKVEGRSKSFTGDGIDQTIAWKTKPDLRQGVVQLNFKIKKADVFSIRFQSKRPIQQGGLIDPTLSVHFFSRMARTRLVSSRS